MESRFVQIIVQQRCLDAYTAYCICIDDRGDTWELRASESNPSDSAKIVFDYYLDYDWWHMYGVIVEHVVEVDI